MRSGTQSKVNCLARWRTIPIIFGDQTMKLYGSIGSPYVARVALATRAKGLSVSPEAPPGGGIKSPEFLRINPLGKMPAVEDNGRHVIESIVILDYLEDAYPQPPLLPSAAIDRAAVRTFGRLCDIYIVPQLGALFRNMNPATRNAADVDAAVASIRKTLGDIEHFADAAGPYLAGKSVSQADCAVAPSMNTLQMVLEGFGVTDLLSGTPKLARWWKQVHSDQICAPVLKDQAVAFRAMMAARR
jgi:glutathione S-transferase